MAWPSLQSLLFCFLEGLGMENRFFSPQLWGWLARVVFVDQQKGLKSTRFSSFRINFTCFRWVDVFHPQLWGWLAGVVFVDQQNGSKSKLFSFASISHVFGGSFFSTPTLGVVARVVFVDQQNGSKGMCFSSFCANCT